MVELALIGVVVPVGELLYMPLLAEAEAAGFWYIFG